MITWPALTSGAWKTTRIAWKYAKPSILLLIVLITEECINPFGFTEALNRQGAQVLQQVAAPLRDLPNVWAAQRTGQDAVTVVLIDRAFIARLNDARRDASTPFAGCLDPVAQPSGAGGDEAPGDDHVLEPRDIRWPLPVGILTRCIIGRIAAAGPKAIFLDFYFPDVARQIEPGGQFTRRQSAMALGQALSQDAAWRDDATRKAVRDVPILIGDDPASVKSNDTSSPTKGVQCTTLANLQNDSLNSPHFRSEAFKDSTDLKGLLPRLETVSVGRLGRPDIYPLAPQTVLLSGHCELSGEVETRPLIARIGRALKTVYLSDPCGSQTKGEPKFLLSPAMRLFQIYKGNPESSKSKSGPKCTDYIAEYFARTGDIIDHTGFRLYRITNPHWLDDLSLTVMQPSWGAIMSAQVQAYLTGKPGARDCLKGQELGGWGMAAKRLTRKESWVISATCDSVGVAKHRRRDTCGPTPPGRSMPARACVIQAI